MKKQFLKKIICAGLIGGVAIFCSPLAADAAIPALSSSKYMKMYIPASGNVPVYTDARLNQRGTSSPFRSYSAFIYPTDEIYVYAINDTFALVSYPTSSGRKQGYVRTSDLTSNNFSKNPQKCKARVANLYVRPNGGRYSNSYISANDNVWTVARSGNYTQVVYPAGAQYKMAWLTNSDYEKCIGQTPTPTPTTTVKYGDANGDGQVDGFDYVLVRDYAWVNKSLPINKKNADVNGDGQIDISDVSLMKMYVEGTIDKFPVEKTATNNDNMKKQVLDKLWHLSQSVDGYRRETKYTGSGQCRGFANKVYTALFNVSGLGGYTNSNYGASTYNGSRVIGYLHGNFGANDTQAMKHLFQYVKPGSIVQMGRRYSLNSSRTAPNPHTAIVYDVDSNGVFFYEANADGKNTIRVWHYTWAQLADRNKGFTIYEPNNYVLK